MKRRPGLMMTAIPAILTAAAVYISLAYAVKLTATVFDKTEPDAFIRSDIGVSHKKLFVEQDPPPSPEEVVEAFRSQLAEESNGTADHQQIILEPVLEGAPFDDEPVRLDIQPVELGPIPNALNAIEAASRESE